MQRPRKHYRIEGGSGGCGARAHAQSSAPQRNLPGAPGPDLGSSDPEQVPVAARQPHPLHAELQAMKDAIAMTKREIASLQRSATGRDGMHRAACELDAVADATERATTTILGAVEEIETAANMLRAAGLGSGRTDHVGTILERVVLLYETCNFQDLTGQRIQKVVSTMKFVEERLDTMIAAWGVKDAQPEGADNPGEDPSGRRLATGPSLPDEVQVSQTEVDAFFT